MKVKSVIFLLLIALVSCKSKKEEVVIVDVAPQDTVKTVVAPPTPEPVVEKIDEGVNQDDKYFLIINSYTVKEFAEGWCKIYKERGYKSDLVMKNEDGYYRLALKSFDDLEPAEKALKEMKKEDEFSNLWIMVR